MTIFRRAVAAICAACVLGTSLPVMAQPSAAPSLITTEEATAASVQQRVGELLAVHVIPRPHSSLEDILPIGKAANQAK